jgi:hypothetical protein
MGFRLRPGRHAFPAARAAVVGNFPDIVGKDAPLSLHIACAPFAQRRLFDHHIGDLPIELQDTSDRRRQMASSGLRNYCVSTRFQIMTPVEVG